MASSRFKKCRGEHGCGKFLLREKFGNDKRRPDGRESMCKKCKKAYMEKRRADPVKRKRELDQAKTPAAKAKRRKSDKARRATRRGRLESQLRSAFTSFATLKQDTPRNRELFGCTLAEFNAHIQSLWEHWMNKDNYGTNTGEYDKFWQFDHIIPFSAFKTYEELEKNQKIVCWFKNVQPMCCKKNTEKQDDFKPEDKQALIRKYQLEEIQAEVFALM